MSTMAKLQFGRLSQAWQGEASDFTPLLAEQLDALGSEIGVDLASVGESEVATTGGRRIDIVAQGEDGSEIVIKNQYGRADHDHLTRGLAYAVARRARGLVVVAEEHRDEFRAVALYLNEMAEHDPDRGIALWLVEAKAVRIGDSPWAPLFSTVVEPNTFTATVERAKREDNRLGSLDEFLAEASAPGLRSAATTVIEQWNSYGHRHRFGPDNVVLEARGPSKNGYRVAVAIYTDGRVGVPFHSYEGMNSGIPIDALITPEFRSTANELFGFTDSQRQARTVACWLTETTAPLLLEFCRNVARAYADALELP